MLRRLLMAGNADVAGAGYEFSVMMKNLAVTLSSGNKLASTTSSGGHFKAFGTNPRQAGKWQFEVLVAALGSDIGVGLTSTLVSYTDATYPCITNQTCCWSRGGYGTRLYNGNTYNTPTSSITAAGDIITVCIDFGAKTAIYKRNGIVIGGAAISISTITPATNVYVPYVALWAGGTSQPTTAVIQDVLTYPEAGYSAW